MQLPQQRAQKMKKEEDMIYLWNLIKFQFLSPNKNYDQDKKEHQDLFNFLFN